jgi:hypothetical protein
MRPNLLLLLSMATCLLAPAVPSQDTKLPSGTGQGKGGEVTKPGAKPDKPGNPGKPLAPGERPRPWVKPLPPKELAAAKAKESGSASKLVKFETSCQPAIVLAGERGTVRVLMTLRGESVMLDPPPVTFKIAPQQGELTVLGEPTFLPADSSGMAPALKNIPAYDNFAIFTLPFEVSKDAQPGKQHLALSVRYELFNGQKGGVIGTFTDHLGIDVQVVAEKPKQVSVINSLKGDKAPTTTNAAASGTAASNGNDSQPLSGSANQVTTAAAEADIESAPEPAPSVAATPTPWILYGSAGALLLAIVLMLTRRR